MSIDRRDFLKKTGLGLGGFFALPVADKVATGSESSEDSAGMLYDSALCVGCKECQVACKERLNSLSPDVGISAYDVDPDNLSAYTWTLIKLYKDEEDDTQSAFVKVQCMHCVDPACVSVCPVGALEKTAAGPVVYDAEKCFGCRYCMAACPFDVPKYQWEKVNPLIQKCDFCADRQAEGSEPACSTSCPTGALQFGKRADLLLTARSRIKNKPDYIKHIYGEYEVGGTAKLYISKVPFEKLGFQAFYAESLPGLTWPWMLSVPGIVVVVGSLMGGIYWVKKRRLEMQKEEV